MSTSSNHSVYAQTLLRLSFGTMLISHGLLKVFVFTVPGTVQFFGGLGLPAIAAYATIFGELVGGTAILLGLYTRLAAALTIPLLLGATWAHSGNGWVFSSPNGGWEYPAYLALIAVVVALQGAGKFAIGSIGFIDRLFKRS
ncbi:MAG: DoxX family protein [Proteobacteria bacterium]|nr:DoxX family protein [Pseudomonadota bacterium]